MGCRGVLDIRSSAEMPCACFTNASCIMQAGLFTVDSQSGKAVEVQPDMHVAQQLRRHLAPPKARRQKIVDLIRRKSSLDLGPRPSISLDIIREGAESPESMARASAEIQKSVARGATLACAASIPARPSQVRGAATLMACM